MVNELFLYLVLCLTSFFTLVNPLGVMPIYMMMTSELKLEERKRTLKKAVLLGFAILLGFTLTGQVLFQFFGISVNSLKIVGGIIFFIMGQDMLHARLEKTKVDENMTKEYVNDISVTPLAIPMIAGPGAITNAIVLMQDAGTVFHKLIVILSLLVIAILTYIILWNSSKILGRLGETGNKVMMRLMGLIVMVIAVEFFFSGFRPIMREILRI